jgi:dTDP-4-dehydrorhamnose reductase
MDLPRILLFGRIGQVGWELRRALAPMAELSCLDFPEIDFTQPDSIRQAIAQARPQVVINAAAYTAVDKAESEPAKAAQINGEAPGVMAEAAKQAGALLVHYSTDYVFDGAKSGPYLETDTPNPLSAYGRSKLAGDLAVQAVAGPHLIFRLCWVYGARGQNFLLTIMRLARERECLRVVEDQVGAPTPCRLIAQATALALRQVLAAREPGPLCGLYHLAAGGATSWHGFATAIVDLMPAEGRKCRRVEPISTPQYPTPARRPANSLMSCAKLEGTFGLRLPPWEDALRLVMES